MSEDRTPTDTPSETRLPSLDLSVAVAYGLAIALVLFLIDLAGPVDLAAFLRILDDLADMGLVQVTDAGEGILIVGLELYEFARMPIRWNVAAAAFACVFGAMLVRGFRHRVIADRAGIDDETTIGNSYHFALGMNLLLPYGPGELGNARTLVRNGADPDAALSTVHYERVFEVLSLVTGVFIALLALGWRGAFIPIAITFVALVVLAALVRPFGHGPDGARSEGRRGIRALLDWMNVTGIARGARQYFRQAPNHAIGVYVISLLAIYLEVTGLWFLKQAFSTPLVVLLGDITYVQFGLVVAAASLTRVVPFTPGAFGIYEGLTVALFYFAFDQGFTPAVTVAFLDSLLIGLVTMLLFLYSLRHGTSVLTTWRSFLGFSRNQVAGHAPPDPAAAVGGDDD